MTRSMRRKAAAAKAAAKKATPKKMTRSQRRKAAAAKKATPAKKAPKKAPAKKAAPKKKMASKSTSTKMTRAQRRAAAAAAKKAAAPKKKAVTQKKKAAAPKKKKAAPAKAKSAKKAAKEMPQRQKKAKTQAKPARKPRASAKKVTTMNNDEGQWYTTPPKKGKTAAGDNGKGGYRYQVFGSVVGQKWGEECWGTGMGLNPNDVPFCAEIMATGTSQYGAENYDRGVVWKKTNKGNWVADMAATKKFIADCRAKLQKALGRKPTIADCARFVENGYKVSAAPRKAAKKAAPMPAKKGTTKKGAPMPSTPRKPLKGHGGRYTAFNKIDYGLAAYYRHVGRKGYYNQQGMGKFMQFVKKHGLNEKDLPKIMNKALDMLPKMDTNFPLKKTKIDAAARKNAIYQVVERCYNYGQIYGLMTHHKTVNWQCFYKPVKGNDKAGRDAVLERMINALKYYAQLDPMHKEANYVQFMEFCNDTYGQVLRDYFYIMNDYPSQDKVEALQKRVKKMFKGMVAPTATNSLLVWLGENKGHRFSNSHYLADRSLDKNNVMFYRDLFDSMYCYLVHNYDVGLRIKVQRITSDKMKIPQVFYFPNKARVPKDSDYAHLKPKVSAAMKRFADPQFKHVATRYCGQERVLVFAKNDAITRT